MTINRCPKCFGHPHTWANTTGTNKKVWIVKCNACQISATGDNKKRAIKKWNKKNTSGKRNKKVFNELRKMLSDYYIRIEVLTVGASGTVYAVFPKNNHIGKVRIGNHPPVNRKESRWHLRTDIEDPYEITQGDNHKVYSYGEIEALARHIRNYHLAHKRRIRDNGCRDETVQRDADGAIPEGN